MTICAPLVEQATIQDLKQCQMVGFVMFFEISLECTLHKLLSLSSKQFHSCPFKYETHKSSLLWFKSYFPSLSSSPIPTSTVDSRPLPSPLLSYLTTRICILNVVVQWMEAHNGGSCSVADMRWRRGCTVVCSSLQKMAIRVLHSQTEGSVTGVRFPIGAKY